MAEGDGWCRAGSEMGSERDPQWHLRGPTTTPCSIDSHSRPSSPLSHGRAYGRPACYHTDTKPSSAFY